MIPSERQQTTLDALARKPFLSIPVMARKLKVSEATVRRDFETLDQLGLVHRVRGGVARMNGARERGSFTERLEVLAAEKERIARAAARLVEDGETIIIDGGTTTSGMSKFIARKNIRVITNSVTVADYLSDVSSVEVIVTGGYLYRASKVLLGQPAILTLRKLNATKTFVSAGGLTFEGIGHSNSLIVETEKMMIARGREAILLADHTKFGTRATANVCPWTKFSKVITDKRVPQPFGDFFKKRGIEVVVAR